MDANPREIGRAFALLLKPSPGKVIIFALLIFMLAFLPLYPAHVDRYIGPAEDQMEELECSGTKMKSLYIVLEGNYNWTELDITIREMGLFVRFTDYHVSYCDADPAYISVYFVLGFLAYFVSCYYVESSKREKKVRQ